MPAHIGLKEKLGIGWAFLVFNTEQTKRGRQLRKQRVTHQKAKLQDMGVDDQTNRMKYLPLKYVENSFERRRGRREQEVLSYPHFRHDLDQYDPRFGRGRTSDPNEWALYLRPGTEFDRDCQAAFDAHYDTDFKMMLITHKSDVNKLKRIEAIFGSGKVEILWTDAS